MKEIEDKKKKDEGMWMDKGQFLAFIAMVMSCADKVHDKDGRIKMILDAARIFLKIDIRGEDMDSKLSDGFALIQTTMG